MFLLSTSVIKESNGNKYLIPVPTDKSKNKLKKYEEIKYEVKLNILLDQQIITHIIMIKIFENQFNSDVI